MYQCVHLCFWATCWSNQISSGIDSCISTWPCCWCFSSRWRTAYPWIKCFDWDAGANHWGDQTSTSSSHITNRQYNSPVKEQPNTCLAIAACWDEVVCDMYCKLHAERTYPWRCGQIHGRTSTCHEETFLAVHRWTTESPGRCFDSAWPALERKDHGERAENSAGLVSMVGPIGCEVVQHLPGEEETKWRWRPNDHWAFILLQALGRLDPTGAWKGSSSQRSFWWWCLLHFEGSDASWCQWCSCSCVGFASWPCQSSGASFKSPQHPTGWTFWRSNQKAGATCWIAKEVQLPYWGYSHWGAGEPERWRSWSALGDMAWWARCGSYAQLGLWRKPVLATLTRSVLPSSCNDEVIHVYGCEKSEVVWKNLSKHISETISQKHLRNYISEPYLRNISETISQKLQFLRHPFHFENLSPFLRHHSCMLSGGIPTSERGHSELGDPFRSKWP